MKNKVTTIVVITMLIVISAVFISHNRRIIGEITGAEWNQLTIGETEYIVNNAYDFNIADKGKYLGKAKYNTLTVCLYSVKGDEEGRYIYAVWDWEGFFFVREEKNSDDLTQSLALDGQVQALLLAVRQ